MKTLINAMQSQYEWLISLKEKELNTAMQKVEKYEKFFYFKQAQRYEEKADKVYRIMSHAWCISYDRKELQQNHFNCNHSRDQIDNSIMTFTGATYLQDVGHY